MTKKPDKLNVSSIRLSEKERKNLLLLSAWHEKTKTELIRDLINQAAEQLRAKS